MRRDFSFLPGANNVSVKKIADKNTAGLSSEAVVSSILTDDMFVSEGDIIEHPVKLADSKEHVMYFKPMTAIDWKKHLEAENSKDPLVRRESSARLISRYLVEPDGRRSLTPQQAARLKPAVSGAIFLAILEVNELFKMPTATLDIKDDDDIIVSIVDEDGDQAVLSGSESDGDQGD